MNPSGDRSPPFPAPPSSRVSLITTRLSARCATARPRSGASRRWRCRLVELVELETAPAHCRRASLDSHATVPSPWVRAPPLQNAVLSEAMQLTITLVDDFFAPSERNAIRARSLAPLHSWAQQDSAPQPPTRASMSTANLDPVAILQPCTLHAPSNRRAKAYAEGRWVESLLPYYESCESLPQQLAFL